MSMTGATMVIPAVAVSLLAGGCADPTLAYATETPGDAFASDALDDADAYAEQEGATLGDRTSFESNDAGSTWQRWGDGEPSA
jgi:hypothetical protein